VLLYGALCHDFGKPATTFQDADLRIRSPNHEAVGVEPAAAFLERLRAPANFTLQVCLLVRYHLAPAHFSAQAASPKAYRRLARKFEAAGMSLTLLEIVARADHFGRTTPDAVARVFPAGDAFLAAAQALRVEEHAIPDVVMGRHLVAMGLKPGPSFGIILKACREIQDETGWTEADKILARALPAAAAARDQPEDLA
jgi:tRNA nucleotidyltransferase (CCA-adding enzyme)